MRNFRFSILYVLAVIYSLTLTAVQAAPIKPINYKEADFSKPELDLSSLNAEQKDFALKILNNNMCTCGCTKGTWANCIKTDIKCPFSRPVGARVVKMIKEGKSKGFILGFFDGWEEGNKRKRRRAKDDPNKIYPVTIMNAPVKGPQDAPVTIIEYTDYQCPFCKKVRATVEELLNDYPGKIRYAVMNNPLPFHKKALPAALAARAAKNQGKFWEMHELIFENSKALDDANLLKMAKKIGLNIEQFNTDRNNEKLKAEIKKEQDQAVKNNARGTPAFFINGKKISGAQPLSRFKTAVDEALQRPKKKSPGSQK